MTAVDTTPPTATPAAAWTDFPLRPTDATAQPVVVAADLDGTLAFDNTHPGPAVTEVLETIADHPDIRLVLTSSRPPPAVHRLMGSLSTGVDLLCCNGALRINRDGSVRRTALDDSLVDLMVAELLMARHDFCLDFGEWFLASAPEALPWMGTSERRLRGPGRLPSGAVKLSVCDAERWLPLFAALAGDAAQLFPHRDKGDLDITPRGVTKATSLDLLLGTHRGHVVALGNDRNDLDLLLAADSAIIVGTGLPELEARPDAQRVASHDDAVAQALWVALDRALTTRQRR